MTLPIERFKDAYFNWRYNPFSAADMAITKVEDGLIIPAGSPFVIQLLEQARYNDTTSVSVRCYGVKTDVDEESLLGQKVLKVAATAGFSPGDTIIIDRGGDREEEKIIDTIQGGISLTVTLNLEYTHTAVQADDVEKYIAFAEVSGAPAQSQYRVDYPPANGGEGTGLVEFNSNDANKEVRITYKATGSPALAETLDTKISYPTGVPDDNQIVGFSSGAPYWLRLPHANLASVSANQHHPQAHSLASHSSKAHSELTGVGINDHHPQVHTHASHSGIGANDHHPQSHTLASHSTRPHSALTGIGTDDHHPQAHALASHSTKAHSELTGVTANLHHPQTHTLVSHSDFSTYLNQAVKTTSSPTFISPSFSTCAISGKLTIGSAVANPSSMLDVRDNNAGAFIAAFEQDSATGWGVLIEGDSVDGGDPLLRIRSGDNVVFTVKADGDIEFRSETTGSAANAYHGPAINSVILRYSCSQRYKDAITDLELDSSKLHNLRPVSFKSLCKADAGKGRFHGLIAEEIKQYYPEIVIYNAKKEAESYDTQMLTTLMLKEIQNLNQRVSELEN